MNRILILLCVAVTMMIMTSCKPGIPDGILDSKQMVNVLYDVHLAQSMASQIAGDSVDYYRALYLNSVFKKYGIVEKDFYNSLAWYERHTDELVSIYDKLAERYGELNAYGNSKEALTQESGDSLNIWRGSPFVLLSSNGETHYSFSQEADTSLLAGDELVWQFSIDWHYHEGAREGTALLIVHYVGDSIAVSQVSLYSSGIQNVRAALASRKVKSVECMVYQDSPVSERPRILAISTPRLFRIRHNTEVYDRVRQDQQALSRDSVNKKNASAQQRLRDSLLRDDTLRERRPHFR